MKKFLFPYQQNAVDYLKKRNYSGALFMAMRLGKTLTTIRATKDLLYQKLVVCPKSVIPSWEQELENEKVDGWRVLNYEQLKNYPFLPDVLIVDESVRIKNPQAQITKLLFQQFSKVRHKILLSGNPAPNHPLEYWAQMAFVKGGEWMGCKNYWQFRQRYFTSDYMGYQWFPKPGTKEKIKKALEEDAFVLTRDQAGLKDRKIYEKRYVEMPPKLRKTYRKLEKEFVLGFPDGKELELDNVLTQINYLQQLAGGFVSKQELSDFKVKELVGLLEGELKGEPVVIWTQFRWEQKMIQQKLAVSETRIINGDTPLEERKKIVDDFNQRRFDYLIISLGCGKYGLNFSKSSTAIYFSNGYSYDTRTQSEDRIVHLSKDEPLLYVDLVTAHTIQDDILKALKRKHTQSKYFMDSVIENLKERVRK